MACQPTAECLDRSKSVMWQYAVLRGISRPDVRRDGRGFASISHCPVFKSISTDRCQQTYLQYVYTDRLFYPPRCMVYKKLSRCWDSRHASRLVQRLSRPKCKLTKSTLFIPDWFSSVQFGIKRLDDQGRLWDEDSQKHIPILVPISTWSQSTSVTDGQTDVMLVA